MVLRPCCVPNCDDKTARRYVIPAEERLREIWVQRVGNPKLFGCKDRTILRNYQVCGNHFADICRDAGGRLLAFSLPTLKLPGYVAPSTRENCFSYPPHSSKFVTPDKIREALSKMEEPSHMSSNDDNLEVKMPTAVYFSKRSTRSSAFQAGQTGYQPVASTSVMSDIPSTSAMSDIPSTSGMSHLASSQTDEFFSIAGVRPLSRSPSPSAKRNVRYVGRVTPPRTKGLLNLAGTTRQTHLTPKARIFYTRAKQLERMAQRHKAKRLSTKRTLRFLNSKMHSLTYLKDVNEATANFFLSQQRTQKYKPRGRRFTLEDKIFALSIYKQSGKGYRYLSKIFSLPSRKVLTSVLNEIPFNCGINEAIFRHLKQRVDRLSVLGKYCILMFDEISLDTGLQYSQRNDVIEGFVDFGGADRRASFADHAIVFILKGIFKAMYTTIWDRGCTF